MKRKIIGALLALLVGVLCVAASPVFTQFGGNIYAQAYLPSGYKFGTLTSGHPTSFADRGTSLAAAQAAYGAGLVTSTAQYIDNVVDQYALNQATSLAVTQGKTCVVLPSGSQFWDRQVTYDAGYTCLLNTGGGGTVIRTQTVGAGTAALRITGTFLEGGMVLRGVAFVAFNSGPLPAPGAQGGVAFAGGVPSGMTVPSGFYYYTGSIALALDNVSSGVMENVSFYNYDKPMTYLTGNVYIWEFRNFTYKWNNEGINIDSLPSNSFEAMRWSGGQSSNNNYNVYFGMGGGSGSLFINNMSLDYPSVQQVFFDAGGGAGNDLTIPLQLNHNHIETNNVATGTGCRITNGGNLFMAGNEIDEEGTFPIGVVCPMFYGRESLVNNIIPGQGPGGAYVPAVYAASAIQWGPTGSGNSQRYGGDVLLYRSPDGDMMGGPTVYGSGAGPVAGSFSLNMQIQIPITYISGGGTITVPPAATMHPANRIPFRFETLDSNTWTISCAGPPACSGTLTGIGGAAGTKFQLTPTATDVWQR